MQTVILTGGGSRRMGRDKAMLPFGGTTMLQYLINKYSVLGGVMVSVNVGGRFQFNGAREIVDRYPDLGPLNGIVSAFEACEDDKIFLTATDVPYGDTELVGKLLSLSEGYDACVMRRGKKGIEPLFAIYGRACHSVCVHCLEHGKKSVFDLLELVKVRYVEPGELKSFDLEHILTNINTADEYEGLKCE